jgi:hypothetical protein
VEGKLREINALEVSPDVDTSRATAGLDNLDKSAVSAGKSSSVLANTIGNASQDLGEMGGIAGTAGVAIGQMGEYIADSADSGEKLTSVLSSFATVAGPIAIIVTATKIAADVMGRAAESASRHKAAVESWTDAMQEGGDAATAYAQDLRESEQILLDITATQNALENATAELNQHWYSAGAGVELLGKALGVTSDETRDIVPLLAAAGVSAQQFADVVADPTLLAGFEASLRRTSLSAEDQAAIMQTVAQHTDAYAAAQENANHFATVFAATQEDIVDAAREWATANRPIEDMPRTWQAAATAAEALRRGQTLTAEHTRAITTLMSEYGLTAEQVLTRGAQLWDTHGDAVAEAEAAQIEAWREGLRSLQERAVAEKAATEAAQAAAHERRVAAEQEQVAIAQAVLALQEMSSEFAGMARREQALSAIFDLGNAGIEAVGQIHNVQEAIRDLAAFVEAEGVPNILDPADVDAGPFLDKIAALRGPIQDAVTQAFAAGGPAAATQVADQYVAQIVQSLGGRLTEQQVRELLNLDNLQATIDLAVKEEGILRVQQTLAILTGLNGETPYTASIALALAAGDITPEAAQTLVNDQLRGQGVLIPGALAGIETAEARQQAQDFLSRQPPLTAPTRLGYPDPAALSAAQRDMLRYPLTQPVRMLMSGASTYAAAFGPGLDAGGTAPPGGALMAERGPEILNDRYLVTQPTIIPAGSRVTSRVRTARILRTARAAKLRQLDDGGSVPTLPTVNVSINAAVIGNRWDVARTVDRAGRDAVRLQGSRS